MPLYRLWVGHKNREDGYELETPSKELAIEFLNKHEGNSIAYCLEVCEVYDSLKDIRDFFEIEGMFKKNG